MQPTLAPPTVQHVYRAAVWHLPPFAWGIGGWLCLVTVNWLVHLLFHSAFDPFREAGLFPFMYCAIVFTSTPRPTLIVTPERFEYTSGRRRFWAYWDTVETVTRLPLHRSGLINTPAPVRRTLLAAWSPVIIERYRLCRPAQRRRLDHHTRHCLRVDWCVMEVDQR